MKYEIRLGGKGGQGLVLAGIILGEAASTYENFYAVQRQSYGPEARGGASRSDVIISDEEIEYPIIDEPDILLAMSQEAYEKYVHQLKKGGILLIDKSLVLENVADRNTKLYSVDFTKLARKSFNMEMVANIIALGTIVNLLKIISKDSILKVLEKRVSLKYFATNQNALELGMSFSEGETIEFV